jgi:hypothetical protein
MLLPHIFVLPCEQGIHTKNRMPKVKLRPRLATQPEEMWFAPALLLASSFSRIV